MSTNFSSLRASRQAALAKLNEEIKKESTKGGADERFWKLSVDQKTKVGYARLRFLPAPKGEDVPWVKVLTHSFKLNGAWFIENCPTTLGTERPCPVCKANSKLWNGPGADKDGSQAVARERKRGHRYISNILVIEDPSHPENNGKVFLFKYGVKIKDKIQEMINPQFPDQQPTNPFDMWNENDTGGSDFKLKAQLKEGYQNYDKSEFADPAELFPGDDKAKEALWDKEYALQPFVAADQFKSYDDIEKRFLKVVMGTGNDRTAADVVKDEQATPEDAASLAADIDAREASDAKKTRKATKPKAAAPVALPDTDDVSLPEDEEKIKAFFGDMLDDAN